MSKNESIEVRITQAEIDAQGPNNVCQGNMIMNRLRAAGVPVIGVLFPLGVERGALTMSNDDLFGERVYRWTEETPA